MQCRRHTKTGEDRGVQPAHCWRGWHLHEQHWKDFVLAILRRALWVGSNETFGDRGFPIVGWSDDQEVAGPDTAGLLRQHALEQRERLACSRVANPAMRAVKTWGTLDRPTLNLAA